MGAGGAALGGRLHLEQYIFDVARFVEATFGALEPGEHVALPQRAEIDLGC